jgi:hypothetical protein
LVQEFLPMNTYLIARTYITYVIVYTWSFVRKKLQL